MKTGCALKAGLAALLRPLVCLCDNEGGRLHRLWQFARLAARFPQLDPSVIVLGYPELHGSRRICFGRELYLYRDLYLETQEEGHIHIGDRVVLSRGVHLVAFRSIEIGAGSMIGEYTSLRDANHRVGCPVLRNSGHDSTPIKVGRNVWIGRGVTILPGVHIGDGAVVGANAVVTRDVAAGAVVAGIPARPIRKETLS